MKKHCRLPTPCEPDTPTPAPQPTPAFDLCVGDYAIHWDGTHLTHTRERVTPDGTYGTITMQGGCVVGYGECEVPVYTPPYCNPNPVPCGEGNGATGGTTTTISPKAENLLRQDNFGLFAGVSVSGGNGVSVTGNGTPSSPITISLASNGADDGTTPTVIGTGGIDATKRNGVTYLSLTKPAGFTGGKYGAFRVDDYGRIVGHDENVQSLTSENVQGGEETTVTTTGENVQIGLKDSPARGTHDVGAYTLTISEGGRVIGINDNSNVQAGTYKLGAYKVTISAGGGITAIEQDAEVPAGAGSFTTSDGSVVHYDDTGRITKVDAPTGTRKGPIIDSYHITYNKPDDGFAGQHFSSTTSEGLVVHEAVSFTNTFVYDLPSYVQDESQVEISKYGQIRSVTVDMENRTITVRGGGVASRDWSGSVTITFRG